MRTIVDVAARRVVLGLHTPFVTALRRTSTVEVVVVRVVDSDGVSGWGEAPQSWQVTGESAAGIVACVEGPMREALLAGPADLGGAADRNDPLGPLSRVQSCVAGNSGARMALDVALHDLTARRAGVDLVEHLAAYAGRAVPYLPHRRVETDVTLAAGTAASMAAAAGQRVGEGFTTLKLKLGAERASDPGVRLRPDLDPDLARVRAVRAAIGPDVGLRVDANQGWDAHRAVRLVRAMEDEELGVDLVEQPVPARDLLGLAHVRVHVDTPVAADESLVDLDDLVTLLGRGACDVVNVKLAKCGGLTPALGLLDVAARHGLGTLVGSMMEDHLGVGAAGALVAALGTSEAVNDLDAAWWLRSSAYLGGPRYDGRVLVLPDGPGLGIETLHGGGWGAVTDA